jgi:hypothetical protein
MTITMINPLQNSFLLRLPVEMRLMIYEHLLNQGGPHVARQRRETHPRDKSPHHPRISISRYGDDVDGLDSIHARDVQADFAALQATSRQIYHETRKYITYPNLKMLISMVVPELKPEFVGLQSKDQYLSYQPLRENIVHVSLFLTRPVQYTSSFQMLSSQAINIFKRISGKGLELRAPSSVNELSLKSLIGSLLEYPNLTSVSMETTQGDLLDLWDGTDNLYDLDIFAPFLQRGVKVEMVERGSKVERSRDTYEALTDKTREVFLEPRSSLRWGCSVLEVRSRKRGTSNSGKGELLNLSLQWYFQDTYAQ